MPCLVQKMGSSYTPLQDYSKCKKLKEALILDTRGKLMEWYDSYNIGVQAIDRQHKELVRRISRLQMTLPSGDINREVGDALRFLVDYTKHHFADEEAIMRSINYEDLPHHKELHKKFVSAVVLILMDLKKGKAIDPLAFIDFLTNWLINHIRHEDQKIAKRLAAIGGGKER